MYVKEAEFHELDTIYAIGFDSWNNGLSDEKYLDECRGSEKYQAGTWYVLMENDDILSSLIVYHGRFNLKEGYFGIGSVATPYKLRGKGYASHLINLVKAELFLNHNAKAIFLHSDIGHQFYNRLGFVSVGGSDCMYISHDSSKFDGVLPTYF